MKAALVILDGWGLGDHDRRDAVKAARTPAFERLSEAGAVGTLTTHGREVGLPDDQMGNSEVGHMNIGAGRTVFQAYTRINDAIEAGELTTNDAIGSAFQHVGSSGSRLHLAGLMSDGGVHADQKHCHALIRAAAARGIETVTHAFTDGRDTSPKSGRKYLAELEAVAADTGTGEPATVAGRYYAMDRDENWDRTKRAYDAIVNREAEHRAPSAVDAVEASYERGDTDEFVEPTVIEGGPRVKDGDAVVFLNFRADRARQLTRMIADLRPDSWRREGFETAPPETHVVTMTEYDKRFDLPVAFPPHQPDQTLGEILAEVGMTQLRIAESEKYAHVTYFLNGGREVEFPGELRRIIDSPDVPTYDERPEMSAPEVTTVAIDVLRSDDPDVLILNYANPDMVGHTGDFEAAVAAVETVDEQLGRLVDAIQAAGGHVLITADHGNADDMGTPDDPHTAHTFAPVPFVYLTPDGTDGGMRIREEGSLPDIAPTLLELLDIEPPTVMTGTSLLIPPGVDERGHESRF